MAKLKNKELSRFDLEEISVRLRKFSKEVIRVKVHASKADIMRICRDESTIKHIDVIHSATITINGVLFELIVSGKK